jgi:site-specific DNA recombinase
MSSIRVVDGGEPAKNLNRPGVLWLLAMADARQIDALIIPKLDRLTRSVKDLGELLERFERWGCIAHLGSRVARYRLGGRTARNQSPDRSQPWEQEAIGERTHDAMRHKRANGGRVGNLAYGID